MHANFYLAVIEGPKAGKKYPFNKECVNIGRNNSNDLILEDDSVSSEHACITLENTRPFLDDLQSKNGTYHHREGYIRQKILLRDGDQFSLGDTLLKFLERTKITDGLHLTVTKGPEAGRVFSFDNKPICIGRTVMDNDLSLNNQSISKKHVKITFTDGQIFLQDLGSRNNTYCNCYTLFSGETVVLHAEDEFSLGKTVSFRVGLKMNQQGQTVMMSESPVKDIITNSGKVSYDFFIIGGLTIILLLLIVLLYFSDVS
jgi:pSer/pThr/pTyr-binding forkhead associated (FHA) protein